MQARTLTCDAPVVPLGAARSRDRELVGGKAAGLARLAALGLAVPRGVCVSADAFAAWQRHHGIGAEVAALAARLPAPQAAAELAALVRGRPLPPALAAALSDALTQLSPQHGFAVRSSGVGEDDSASSFAGLHETVIGVAAADVPAALAECWASTWSPAALSYSVRLGLQLPAEAIPVLVQEVVPAVASAVVFTVDPVTGATRELLANVVRGMGEPLVRGSITPDVYVVHKRTGMVLEATAGEPGASVELRRSQLRALAELCLRIEQGFGHPVDVEAALAGGRWAVLQARPLTTLVA